jgi:hypothetical protein
MKAIIIVLVLLAAGLGILYFRGGYHSFDPTAEGNKAKAAIKPGMTWKQVLDIAGKGGKYRHIIKTVQKIKGEDVEQVIVGTPVELKPDLLAARLASNQAPEGFVIEYFFSAQVAFDVVFDSAGLVNEVQDIMTGADLLGTRKHAPGQ